MSETRRPLLDLHHLGHQQTGNESWARGLAAALFDLDGSGAYDIAITLTAPSEDLALLPARERVVVGSIAARRLAWELPVALRRLRSSAVLVQYTAPLTRVPAVVAVHDLSFEHPRAREWLPLATLLRYRASIRSSVGRAAHVLALSNSTRQDLIERYGIDPSFVTVVPPAVDRRLARLLRETPESRDGPLKVLTVGNVLPRKNLLVVAQAVRILRDRGHDAVLRVVGSVPEQGRVHATSMVRILGESVEFCHHVTPVELAQNYRSAHVLAFPSLFEGFGIPVIEAMAARLPVVVSDRTALPEVVGDAGRVAPAEDPVAWADLLEEAVFGAGRAGLVEKAAKRQLNFDWQSSAAITSRVLAEAGAEPPARDDRLGWGR